MITLETVMAALPVEERAGERTRVGFTETAPGWTTTGQIAVRFTDYPDGISGAWLDRSEGVKFSESFPRYIASWEDVSRRTPITEDEALFIPPVAEIPDVGEQCSDCKGSGEHECSCGDLHVCGECDGEGLIVEKRGQREKRGRAVFRSEDGKYTLIAGKFAPLLRGYSVFRFDSRGKDMIDPLIGVDGDGRVVVCVMPMHGEPEVPAKAEAQV